MAINGLAVGSVAVGSLFVYSAIKGKSVLATAQAVITGQNPGNVSQANPITNPPPTTGTTDNVSGGSFVGIARSYIGKLTYVFGGPNKANPGSVDCSSFSSLVLHQGGISDPGGSPYNPNIHGPNTLSYLAWSGATTVGHSESSAQPDYLIVGPTHMGICSGSGNYVSALNPSMGVKETPISTFPDPIFSIRRVD